MKLTGEHLYLRYYEAAGSEAFLELQFRNQPFFAAFSATRNDFLLHS